MYGYEGADSGVRDVPSCNVTIQVYRNDYGIISFPSGIGMA